MAGHEVLHKVLESMCHSNKDGDLEELKIMDSSLIDPGPILDCTGCLVSSSQKYQDFFPSCFFLYFTAGSNANSEGRQATDCWHGSEQPALQLESMLTLLQSPLHLVGH